MLTYHFAIFLFAFFGALALPSFGLHSLDMVASADLQQDPEIKEWHFHVYWFHTNKQSTQEAMDLHAKLLQAVLNKEFIAVFHGVEAVQLPGLDESSIPPLNMGPRGPHPSGSFEVWVPKEYLAQALSWFMVHRGSLSVLLHPLSRHEVEDHSRRAAFLGQPWKIDLSVLTEDLIEPPRQYPALKLGYSAPNSTTL